MIEVSVVAGELVAKRRSSLSITFANTGPGPCSDVVFKLALPSGVMLVGGSERVDIPIIAPGRVHAREFLVQPRRPGRFELTSTNFSYRDELDEPIRVTDFRAVLVVAPARLPEPIRQPTGRLGVEYEGGELELGAWDVMRIVATNRTGIPLNDVTMTVDGPFLGDGKRTRVAELANEGRARFPFPVNADVGGRHVPVTVRTTYSYPDGGGEVRTRTQQDSITVVVRPAKPEPTKPEPTKPRPTKPRPIKPEPAATPPVERTVLYLTASPPRLPRLRSDREMREVKERLLRSQVRDRYRIEAAFAVRFDDISQALIDYEPQVVHFSGHGDKFGNLCLEDEKGEVDSITPEGLAALIGQHRSTIRCVVVNACYSERLAEALSDQIEYVIGMRYEIEDDAAIRFSVGFYVGFFGGQAVPEAFGRGLAHIRAKPTSGQDHLTPLIFPPGPGAS